MLNRSMMKNVFVLLLHPSESGRSIVCPARDATLQCDSGQVLMIEGSFYGRENIHYCRSTGLPPTTPTRPQCSWVDVVESLKGKMWSNHVCV